MSIFHFFKKKSNKRPGSLLEILAKTDHLNNLGVQAYMEGNIALAISYYKQALAVFPKNDDALINLARCHLQMKLYEQAVEFCKIAISIDPNRKEAYHTLGDAYMELSFVGRGIECYKIAAKLGDESAKNYLERWGLNQYD